MSSSRRGGGGRGAHHQRLYSHQQPARETTSVRRIPIDLVNAPSNAPLNGPVPRSKSAVLPNDPAVIQFLVKATEKMSLAPVAAPAPTVGPAASAVPVAQNLSGRPVPAPPKTPPAPVPAEGKASQQVHILSKHKEAIKSTELAPSSVSVAVAPSSGVAAAAAAIVSEGPAAPGGPPAAIRQNAQNVQGTPETGTGTETGANDEQCDNDSDNRDNRRRSAFNRENYKTEICISFHNKSTCEYGENCQFAHGVAELRPRNFGPKYKTQMCKNYHEDGNCRFGTRCKFIHDEYRTIGKNPNEFLLVSPTEELVRVEIVTDENRRKTLLALIASEDADRERKQGRFGPAFMTLAPTQQQHQNTKVPLAMTSGTLVARPLHSETKCDIPTGPAPPMSADQWLLFQHQQQQLHQQQLLWLHWQQQQAHYLRSGPYGGPTMPMQMPMPMAPAAVSAAVSAAPAPALVPYNAPQVAQAHAGPHSGPPQQPQQQVYAMPIPKPFASANLLSHQ
jgi:hypothetical protein